MRCSYCGKVINDINKFILHIEYAHHTRQNYECPFNMCSRSFHRRDNFKKHLCLNHKSQITADEPSISNNTSEPNLQLENTFGCQVQGTTSSKANIEPNLLKQNFDLDKKTSEFQARLHKAVLELISKLYADNSVARSFIQKITEYFKSFFHSGFISILKEILIFLVTNPTDFDKTEVVEGICNKILNSLDFVDTDYKRINYFKKSESYILPVPITVGFSQDASKKYNETSLVLKERTAIYIPISETLKLFLELPGVLNKIIQYHNLTYLKKSFLENNTDDVILKNLLDGSLWKNTLS